MLFVVDYLSGPAQGAAVQIRDNKQNFRFAFSVRLRAHREGGVALGYKTEKFRGLAAELVRLGDPRLVYGR